MRQSLLFTMAFTSVLLSAGKNAAHAGAWLRAEGQSEIIFSTRVSSASRQFDASGKPAATGKFSKIAAEAIGEYGLNKNLTLIAGATGQGQKFSLFTMQQNSMGLSGSAGARLRLWSKDQSVISLQTTFELSSERQKNLAPAARFDSPALADVRLLFGRGFTTHGMQAFVDLQTGYRWRGGSHADEIRIDLTFGLRPSPKFLLLFQSFNSVAMESSKHFQSKPARQHKVQASFVYELTQGLALQAGGFASIAGRETLKERGGLIALWWKL
jgi:protein XagA